MTDDVVKLFDELDSPDLAVTDELIKKTAESLSKIVFAAVSNLSHTEFKETILKVKSVAPMIKMLF